MSNGIGQRPTEKFSEAASQSIVRGKKKKKRKKWFTANKSKDKI